MGSQRQSLITDVERHILKDSKELSRAFEENLQTLSLQRHEEPSTHPAKATSAATWPSCEASAPGGGAILTPVLLWGCRQLPLGVLSPCRLGSTLRSHEPALPRCRCRCRCRSENLARRTGCLAGSGLLTRRPGPLLRCQQDASTVRATRPPRPGRSLGRGVVSGTSPFSRFPDDFKTTVSVSTSLGHGKPVHSHFALETKSQQTNASTENICAAIPRRNLGNTSRAGWLFSQHSPRVYGGRVHPPLCLLLDVPGKQLCSTIFQNAGGGRGDVVNPQ